METIKSFFQNIWNKVVGWAELIWNNSWTKLLAWLTGIPSSLLLLATSINQIIIDPTFKGYLDSIHVDPKVTTALTIFSMLVWLAHGRKSD